MKDIFLVSIGGIRYGVWKDEILSVRDISALHRIPLSPAKIAGILIDDGKTVTLADLPECIGLVNSTKGDEGSILIMEDGERVIGFTVSGEIDTLSIPPSSLLPVPEILKTPVFESCAVHNDIPIPIIKLAALYSIVMKGSDELAAYSPNMAMAQPMDASAVSLIRFFTAGGERYALSASGIDDTAVKPGAITLLPNMAPYVRGVTSRDGRLLPVIDLSQRIKRRKGAPDSVMLTAKIGGETFGLLVDGDEGTLPAHKVAIRQAPMIVRTSWMRHFVMRAGEPVPLVDLAIALSPDSRAADEIPVWQRYTPQSPFPDLFFEQNVDVVEFSLLGERHALPKQEVEDVIAYKPCRMIQDVPPIVLGVAEHNGEILPVLDLAMMFGRRSIAIPGWRMMLVHNGDFRALVITETVFKERQLTLDIHRAVPIHLPHDLMYGCYPDVEAVKLIFNVEAIAVHFEKSLIQKFLPALSQGMKMKSEEAELVPELLQQAGLEADNTILVQEAVTEAGVAVPESEQGYIAHPAMTEELNQVTLASSGKWNEWGSGKAVEQENIPITESMPEEIISDEPATGVQTSDGENRDPEQFEPSTTEMQSTAKIQPQNETGIVEFSGEGDKKVEPEGIGEQKPEERFPEMGSIQTPSIESPPREPERVPRANTTAHMKSKQISTKEKLEALLARGAAIKSSDGNRLSNQMDSAEGGFSAEPYHMEPESKREEGLQHVAKVANHNDGGWKRKVVYSAIGVVLVALLYVAGSSRQQVVESTIKANVPEKIETTRLQPEQPRIADENTKATALQADAEREIKQANETRNKAAETLVLTPLADVRNNPPFTLQKPAAQLELDIPPTMPVDADVYEVQEGDTLWSISERFTGSPFNYPRIAGENRIADPDLIFPGQKIHLIK